MKAYPFCDLVANTHYGIKMAGRILENHTNLATTHRKQFSFARLCQIRAAEHDRTCGDL